MVFYAYLSCRDSMRVIWVTKQTFIKYNFKHKKERVKKNGKNSLSRNSRHISSLSPKDYVLRMKWLRLLVS